MLAIAFQHAGDANTLITNYYPTPLLKSGHVLIKVVAAGVNRPDIMQRQGRYPAPAGITSIFGLEVSGNVIAIAPDVQTLNIGDPVCALVQGGGYAEYCLANAQLCLPIPDHIPLIDAAGLPETFFTVWSNLFDRAQLQKGDLKTYKEQRFPNQAQNLMPRQLSAGPAKFSQRWQASQCP